MEGRRKRWWRDRDEAGSVAALALLSWLATVLWVLAIIGLVILTAIVGGVFPLRRSRR